MKLFPRKNSVWWVLGWSQLFLVVAFFVNLISGHNYGYLKAKPVGTILDHFRTGTVAHFRNGVARADLSSTFSIIPWVIRRRLVKSENP